MKVFLLILLAVFVESRDLGASRQARDKLLEQRDQLRQDARLLLDPASFTEEDFTDPERRKALQERVNLEQAKNAEYVFQVEVQVSLKESKVI